MKNSRSVFIILLLLGITIFSVFKYISALKEKDILASGIEKMQAQVAALESEKQQLVQALEKEKASQQGLAQENSSLKENLKIAEGKLVGLEEEFARAGKALAELKSQFSLLKEENTALQKAGESLKAQILKLTRENEDFTARFHSAAELKKAIQELKLKMRQVKREIKKKAVLISNSEGNRGFMVRDGKSTQPAQVKIEVKPAS